jgi:acyl phosphate:glycerol-3-phosphate acyltransferase
MSIAFFFILSYLIGSIPFGLLFSKLIMNKDIRELGSGNIGATNAFRAGGFKLGALTFIFDFFKGVFAVFITQLHTLELQYLCISAFLAVIGHMYPVWLRFNGGKGVATTASVITYLDPILGLAAFVCWAIVFGISRTSSLASLTTTIISNIISYFISQNEVVILLLLLSTIIFLKHSDNIKRLLEKKEKSF